MVGFNRRFIPKVRELKEHGKPDFLLMQKNRFHEPDHPRRFVVEDFIHVVDTLRFLMGTAVKDVQVQYLKRRPAPSPRHSADRCGLHGCRHHEPGRRCDRRNDRILGPSS